MPLLWGYHVAADGLRLCAPDHRDQSVQRRHGRPRRRVASRMALARHPAAHLRGECPLPRADDHRARRHRRWRVSRTSRIPWRTWRRPLPVREQGALLVGRHPGGRRRGTRVDGTVRLANRSDPATAIHAVSGRDRRRARVPCWRGDDGSLSATRGHEARSDRVLRGRRRDDVAHGDGAAARVVRVVARAHVWPVLALRAAARRVEHPRAGTRCGCRPCCACRCSPPPARRRCCMWLPAGAGRSLCSP